MAYEFFFSYTRSDNDAYLKRLFKDLSAWVRRLVGARNEDSVGFFDQRNIELGAAWDATIVDALQRSKVMVCAGSPAYFESVYCGKEWALFRLRCQATAAGGRVPPLIKPIVWVPYKIDSLPPEVQATQLLRGDPADDANTKGLIYLQRRKPAGYDEFVRQLAIEIIAAGQNHPIAPLQNVPTLAEVPSAFHPPPTGGVQAPPRSVQADAAAAAARPAGPKHVHFVFVAAHPEAFGAARSPDAYYESGAGDWKPFFPQDVRPINPLLQQVASSNDMMYSSAEVGFGPGLLDLIDQARERRQMVVIVVDPWSLHWDAQQANPSYRELLVQLDRRLDYHWCVLVPWNEQDPAWTSQRDAITSTVRETFDRHANLLPLFYREGITSANQLQTTVAETLTRLKEEISKRAPVVRPVPAGPTRPLVTGPSSQRSAP